jgi:hypothetical protein
MNELYSTGRRFLAWFWFFLVPARTISAEVNHTILLDPGSALEATAVIAESGTTVKDQIRRATAGGGWTYGLVLPPGTSCVMAFDATGRPEVTAVGADGLQLPIQHDTGEGVHRLQFAVPQTHPLGSKVQFQLRAIAGPVAVRNVKLILAMSDRNHDGLSDVIERLMGIEPGQQAVIEPRPEQPHTSFFYAWRYDPALAIPTDAVRLYFWSADSDCNMYATWADKGYAAQTMIHSRFGQEVRDRMDEVQTRRDGSLFSVAEGPNPDYYKVPTVGRTRLAQLYYSGPLAAGATGIGYDEPEFHVLTGYSEAFKQEWQARYGAPWQPPHSSIEARYKAEQLKVFLFRRQVEAILSDAERRKPAATRLIATHSPLNYPHWGFVSMQHELLQIPALQEIIAEVWTGTARTPVTIGGLKAERTFELGYLEYSSCYHLVRGTGKRLWFLMDPMEDNPNRTMEDYHDNYAQTLLAALMFPSIDSYEVLVWPNRIFSRVPKAYAILINTVVGALCELWRYPDGSVEAGSEGIGTFIADSIGWQRADPSPSDYEGFLGLGLPLVLHGVPVAVLSLDRAAEPNYLDGFKCLLLSYDFLKPKGPVLHEALADWVRRGGTLIFIGGTDAYNALSESWWRQAGYATPAEHLFTQVGLPLRHAKVILGSSQDGVLETATPTFQGALQRLRVPRVYPITLYAPPTGATTPYQIPGESLPPVWETAVGKGTVIFVGVAAGYFSATEESALWLRALTRRGYEKSGGRYREQPYFQVRRGPYVGLRTLNKDYSGTGRFVDLLSPTLAVVDNPKVTARSSAFWRQLGPAQDSPRVVAVSGRLRARHEQSLATAFWVQAPARTEGAARIWAGNKTVGEAKAFTIMGAPVPLTYRDDGDTVLLQYANEADGIVGRIQWCEP